MEEAPELTALEWTPDKGREIVDGPNLKRISHPILFIQCFFEPLLCVLGGTDYERDVMSEIRHGRAHVHDLDRICKPGRIAGEVNVQDFHGKQGQGFGVAGVPDMLERKVCEVAVVAAHLRRFLGTRIWSQ